MTREKISILSTAINALLAFLKLTVGFMAKSNALIADGIHSGVDIISSGVTFLGIKGAKKPENKEHPYGHYRAETVAGFIFALLLLISAVWITYEGIQAIIWPTIFAKRIFWALAVVIISIIINEIMARIKFKIGKRDDSLALVADAEHSRADSISSVAVLIGLSLTRWFAPADGIAAILVGIYIFWRACSLGKEVADNLLDIANPQIEEEIKKICQKEEINLLEVKTRRIGTRNFAELKIGLNKEWKMQKVSEVIENLEDLLIKQIESLQFVVIQVVSHEFERGFIKSKLGKIEKFKNLKSELHLKKMGRRTIISAQDSQFYFDFGAPEYLVIDQDKDKNILQKEIIKNPYFVTGRGYGVRFVRAIGADQVITSQIGHGARERLREMGVEIQIVPENSEIEEIVLKI